METCLPTVEAVLCLLECILLNDDAAPRLVDFFFWPADAVLRSAFCHLTGAVGRAGLTVADVICFIVDSVELELDAVTLVMSAVFDVAVVRRGGWML